jgi:hypothetical protein
MLAQRSLNRHREAALAAVAIQRIRNQTWIASGFAALAVAMTSDSELRAEC